MKRMTSRERLWAAIEGEPVDTIPVGPRIWRYARWKATAEQELARKLDYDMIGFVGGLGNGVTNGHDEWIRPLLPDVKIEIKKERHPAKTVFERTFHTPAGKLHDLIVHADPGGEYGISPNPEWREVLIKTSEDVERLAYLLPEASWVKSDFEHSRQVEAELGDAGIVAYRPTIGPDNIVVDALGVERALTASIEEPELFDRALEITDRWHAAVMKNILEAGFRIIFDPWFNFSLSVGWSPKFYRDKVVPRLKKHAELIHAYGAKMFFYDDGKQAKSIGYVIDAGADIIQTLTPPPAGDLDFNWLAATYGGRVCFNGGVDTVKIRFGKPQAIAQDVRDRLDVLAPTRRFILGTSDSITEGTPEENLWAYFNTAREYGKRIAKRLYG